MDRTLSCALVATGCFMLSLLSTDVARAAVLSQSTFDADDEGWLVGELFAPSGTSVPGYVASGGNPGGFVRTNDLYSWNAYVAPAVFLGDQSDALGGSLIFDTRVSSLDGIAYYAVVLEGGGLQLGYNSGLPTTDWSTFTIPLTADGWNQDLQNSGVGGTPVAEADFLAVMSNLTALRIQADWQTGLDQIDLDNVRLESSSTPIPEPASLLLLATGLFSLGAARKKSRR
jgi:hypothetical protein